MELVVESRWTLLRDEEGNPKRILIIDTDITEKKAIETRFLRSQRMDSIGALASGVAHDLNNALAPVIMGTELVRTCQDAEDRNTYLDIVDSNARRATELVRQILGFARGSGGQLGPVQLEHDIRDIGRMIQETFPKSISLSLVFPGEKLWTVRGDATELHQVLLNLCVNSRDAMPQGGQLTLSAQNCEMSEEAAAALCGKPGSYVKVSVADNGTGIPPEVLPRIFEPFFTTKKVAGGTGLGLATVAAIVKRHEGFMDIQTQAGRGTEFTIYLPAVDSTKPDAAEPKDRVLPAGHGELILVIDDEQTLLELAKAMLESFSYQVITAQDGLQGMALFTQKQNEIALVLTDADMPNMDGMAVIRAIKECGPKSQLSFAAAPGATRVNWNKSGRRICKNPSPLNNSFGRSIRPCTADTPPHFCD